jgi:hypothetical protein
MSALETTTAALRTELVACCEDAADWRLQRAAEFRHNTRKLAAVEALASAAEDIARLRDDDPRLRRLAWVRNRLDPPQRMLALTEQRRAVRQAGYDRIATTTALPPRLGHPGRGSDPAPVAAARAVHVGALEKGQR